MNKLALAGMLVAGLMGTIYAADPSFDCHKAKPNSIESIICSSELLSALDREMVRLYKLATAPGSGARADAEKKEKMAWLKERNQCAKMQALEVCTRDRYSQGGDHAVDNLCSALGLMALGTRDVLHPGRIYPYPPHYCNCGGADQNHSGRRPV